MQVKSIVNCLKGWVVGDFPLAILQDKNCEVAIKRYKKGDYEPKHFHSETVELTVIIEGSVRMNRKFLTKNDAIIVNPLESTDFECLTDVTTVVFKNKSSINDKTLGDSMNNIDDIENFLDPHTFFSFVEETSDSIIIYVSHMNEEVLRITNSIPDKVNNKHVLVHFEAALDDKWAHQNEEIIAAPGKITDIGLDLSNLEVIKALKKEFAEIYSGMNGNGIGQTEDGRYCIRAYVDSCDTSKYPESFKGVPISLVESGPIRALSEVSEEVDDFSPEEVPVFGLSETLSELIQDDDDDSYKYTCYVSSKE